MGRRRGVSKAAEIIADYNPEQILRNVCLLSVMTRRFIFCRFIPAGILLITSFLIQVCAAAGELPVLHLRKALTPPALVAKLDDPSAASAWYPASPMWFGCGGKTGDRNHVEVLATYDDTALYIAFMNIDRSTVLYPKGSVTDLTTVDSDAIWIQTPSGRRFYLIAAMDDGYPPGPKQASGEFPNFDPKSDKLTGWSHSGWQAGGLTIQQTIRIPWSSLYASAPTPGAKWKINFINYNQTSTSRTPSTVNRLTWAPGSETQPESWGTLALDEAVFTPLAGVSPEATLTLRPATGFGGEVTLHAGNAADQINSQTDEALTESNWNDWDPVDYTLKEFMQFDLSMIPRDRKILSATLRNNFRGHYNSNPTDEYLHVVRLVSPYDPKTVTMLNSPLPIENGYRRLVKASEVGSYIDFDVTDCVSHAFDSGLSKVPLALAGSSGDINNGKIWNVSYGRADWYDTGRPQLIITFGRPNVTYPAPAKIGSLNYTSAATTSSKNKLTNGTFAYGTVEGSTNTTYWLDPGWAHVNGQNLPFMTQASDTNPYTGHSALRYMTPAAWKGMYQIATGIIPGKPYTFSGWMKAAVSGHRASARVDFLDSKGNSLAGNYTASSGSTNWEQIAFNITAPAGTVNAKIEIKNWNEGSGSYMLFSDFQLEEGNLPTIYSETMGVYYPNSPRTDGTLTATGTNCIDTNRRMSLGSTVALTGKTVIGAFSGYFYISCGSRVHRFHGIKVISTTPVTVGSTVSVLGTLTTDSNDEIAINATSVIPASGGTLPKLFSCTNASAGGGTLGSVRGPDKGTGPNTIGTLITLWGRISSLSVNTSMILTDGSGTSIKVIGPTGSAANGSFVSVTGICSLEKSSSYHNRVLRTRVVSDVRVWR